MENKDDQIAKLNDDHLKAMVRIAELERSLNAVMLVLQKYTIQVAELQIALEQNRLAQK
jgi:hypothetical protein